MNSLNEVLAFVGGSGILLGAVAWIIRGVMSHAMNRDLEAFKSQLQNATSLESERLRHDLRLVAADSEKRSALLNERRALIISELYKKLVDFLGAAESFAAIADWGNEPTKEEKAVILGDKATEFFSYYQYHRIYFSEELANQLRALFDAVHGSARMLSFWMHRQKASSQAADNHWEAWEKAWSTIEKDVPPILTAIEHEFRALLGVSR
jgi:phage gpG-like protein